MRASTRCGLWLACLVLWCACGEQSAPDIGARTELGSRSDALDDGDTDGDGLADTVDADDDNDNVPDGSDLSPLNAFACYDRDTTATYSKQQTFTNTGYGQTHALALTGLPSKPTGTVQVSVTLSGGDYYYSSANLIVDGVTLGTHGDVGWYPYTTTLSGTYQVTAAAVADASLTVSVVNQPSVREGTVVITVSYQHYQGDGCDDCALAGVPSAVNDGADYDADSMCDGGDADDDDDGIFDANDRCARGTKGWTSTTANDPDADGCHDDLEDDDDADGTLNALDDDDDGDGLLDASDACPHGLPGAATAGDPDTDGDGCKNSEDGDDDADTVADASDAAPLNKLACYDRESTGSYSSGEREYYVYDCDQTSTLTLTSLATRPVGTVQVSVSVRGGDYANGNARVRVDGATVGYLGDGGAQSAVYAVPASAVSDGALTVTVDNEFDICDADISITVSYDYYTFDGCDDCAVNGAPTPRDDGLDTDADGTCNAGDSDDDGDGVLDVADASTLDPRACRDQDRTLSYDSQSQNYYISSSNAGADFTLSLTSLGTKPVSTVSVYAAVSGSAYNTYPATVYVDGTNVGQLGGSGSKSQTFQVSASSVADGALSVEVRSSSNVTSGSVTMRVTYNYYQGDGCDDCAVQATPATSDDGADLDGDAQCDLGDADDDNDGKLDAADSCPRGAIGWTSNATNDPDGDGCNDDTEDDDDGDGAINALDGDDDGDGVLDGVDACQHGATGWTSDGSTDLDGDGCLAAEDADDDGDSVLDTLDIAATDRLVCGDTESAGQYTHTKTFTNTISSQTHTLSLTDLPRDARSSLSVTVSVSGSSYSNYESRVSIEGVYQGYVGDTSNSWGRSSAVFTAAASVVADGALTVTLVSDYGLASGTITVSVSYTQWSGDGCDDCAVRGVQSKTDDGADFDGDVTCDLGDADDDNDGKADAADSCPRGMLGWISTSVTDPDGDGCNDVTEDDDDADGTLNDADDDDDGDGKIDGSDACQHGTTGWTSDPSTDMDADGCKDSAEDGDDDADGVADVADVSPLNPQACADRDQSLRYSTQQVYTNTTYVRDQTYTRSLTGLPTSVTGAVTVTVTLSGNDYRSGYYGALITIDGVGQGRLGPAPTWPLNSVTGTYSLAASSVTDGALTVVVDTDYSVDEGSVTIALAYDYTVADGCDDCAIRGSSTPSDDGVDHDADVLCDLGDPDDDGDGVLDGSDRCPRGALGWATGSVTDPDADGCHDGLEDDDDGDGLLNDVDLDDDADGKLDANDACPHGTTGWISSRDTDLDDDGCEPGEDTDDDGDNVGDGSDSKPLDRFACRDADGDTCDDCGLAGLSAVANDGVDYEGDGKCDAGDTDDDGDGKLDTADRCPLGAKGWTSNATTDPDGDGCHEALEDDDDGDGTLNDVDSDDDGDSVLDVDDRCQHGTVGWTATSETDLDADGCEPGEDTDDDGDTVVDTSDVNALNRFACRDRDILSYAKQQTFTNPGAGTNNAHTLALTGLPKTPVSTLNVTVTLSGSSYQSGSATLYSSSYSYVGSIYGNGTSTTVTKSFALAASTVSTGALSLRIENNGAYATGTVTIAVAYDAYVGDSCDDCAIHGVPTPADDGVSYDGDVFCDLGDPDDDNDGIEDASDRCPKGLLSWTSDLTNDPDQDGCHDELEDDDNGDGTFNVFDDDDDGDGLMDEDDACPHGVATWTSTPETDLDGDGCHPDEDADDDGDTVLDTLDVAPEDAHRCRDDGEHGSYAGQRSFTNTTRAQSHSATFSALPRAVGSTVTVKVTLTGSDYRYEPAAVYIDNSYVGSLGDSTSAAALIGTYTPSSSLLADGTLTVAVSNSYYVYAGGTVLVELSYVGIYPDGCDDCAVSGVPNAGDDGANYDGDGACDVGDPDDDGDGVLDANDDCPLGLMGWTSSSLTDNDADGCQDLSSEDLDRDNDLVADGEDSAPTNGKVCGYDVDGDGCEDCVSGANDPANDGADADHDGLCDAFESDDDADGVLDGSDSCARGTTGWTSDATTDIDGDGCEPNEDTDDDGDQAPDSVDVAKGDRYRCFDRDSAHSYFSTESFTNTTYGQTQAATFSGVPGNPLTAVTARIIVQGSSYQYDGASITVDGVSLGRIGGTKASYYSKTLTVDPASLSDGTIVVAVQNDDYVYEGWVDVYLSYTYAISDGCDDCAIAGQVTPSLDGADLDDDGYCDLGDSDDDGDGVLDVSDHCASGETGWASSGVTDQDGDGCRDDTEDDGDGDGVFDAVDFDDDGDGLGDGVDGCPQGESGWTSGPSTDQDGDGCTAAEDDDDDGDTVGDAADVDPVDPFACIDRDVTRPHAVSKIFDMTSMYAPDQAHAWKVTGLPSSAATDLSVTVTLTSSSYRYYGADISAEGVSLGRLGGSSSSQTTYTATYSLPASAVEDGVLDVLVDNDASVYYEHVTVAIAYDYWIGDGCDDCALDGEPSSANDGLDFDGDARCDLGDTDDDSDGIPDTRDGCPLSSLGWVSTTLNDVDSDGCDDATDDDDGDGLLDAVDADADGDGLGNDADACPTDHVQWTSTHETDLDGDGCAPDMDTDDDDDGVPDEDDVDPIDPLRCVDRDTIRIYDFAQDVQVLEHRLGHNVYVGVPSECKSLDLAVSAEPGTYSTVTATVRVNGIVLGVLDDNAGVQTVSGSVGPATYVDGYVAVVLSHSDAGAVGVAHVTASCSDLAPDGCDDCSSGALDPTHDGSDVDADGQCDVSDADDDGDSVGDEIDGCPQGETGWSTNLDDDADGDGCRDITEEDDDGDGVQNVSDEMPEDAFACGDADADGCDDCASGTRDAADDGDDTDMDGTCDGTDDDLDGDGCSNLFDAAPRLSSDDEDGDGFASDCDPCLDDLDNDADGDGLCSDPECHDSFDCPVGTLCLAGSCVLIPEEPAGSDAGQDADDDAGLADDDAGVADGGVTLEDAGTDAGSPLVDAGSLEHDAGVSPDAAMPSAQADAAAVTPEPDPGVDAGREPRVDPIDMASGPDAGTSEDSVAEPGIDGDEPVAASADDMATQKGSKSGGSCAVGAAPDTAGIAGSMAWLSLLVAAIARRKARRSKTLAA